jgi:hypothetical protein
MKNSLKHLVYAFILLIFPFFSCQSDIEPTAAPSKVYSSETAVQWADMTLLVAKRTASNTPTYASRALGYIGLTMYETVVNGSTIHKSLSGQLADMPNLTKPETGKTYNWAIALNAGQALSIKRFYEHASSTITAKIDSLAAEILKNASKEEKQDVIDRSVKFGETGISTISQRITSSRRVPGVGLFPFGVKRRRVCLCIRIGGATEIS